MKFTKPPTTINEQVELLIKRGMEGDPVLMAERLRCTSYYRLSAYWFTFRKEDRTRQIRYDDFVPGTKFDVVWERYCFDRELRLLVMDAIERIEITVRTQLSHHHSHKHGPFAYAEDPLSLPKLCTAPGLPPDKNKDRLRCEFIERVQEETKRSQDEFKNHFFKKHSDHHSYLPIWMATEVMTFRTVLTMLENCSVKVKDAVADVFDIPNSIFMSWMLTINTVRNIVAHHSRLWNRQIGSNPTIPTGTRYRQWNTPVLIKHDRMFAAFSVINYCVHRVTGNCHWAQRFAELLQKYPNIPVKYMGFSDKWTESPIWEGALLPSPVVGVAGTSLPSVAVPIPFPPEL
ncbi:MAG TPA: Abi family protein [Kofleriaceae bacterium]|nr:Abi family protein [Kofleriaceae bacterium]